MPVRRRFSDIFFFNLQVSKIDRTLMKIKEEVSGLVSPEPASALPGDHYF